MNNKLKIYLGLEYLLFFIMSVYLYLNHLNRVPINEIIFFALILFIMHNISMFFNSLSDTVVSINLPVLLPAIIILGPFWAAIIGLIGAIELQYKKKKFRWYKFFFNITMLYIATGAAGLVFEVAKSHINFKHIFGPLLFSVIAYFIVNNGLIYLAIRLSNTKKKDSSLIIYYSQLIKNLIFSYFMGLLLYFGYIRFGKVLFIMAIILIYIIKDFLYSRIQQLNSFTQIVESFLKVIDSKDQYTEGHCERVARYTYVLCQEMGLNRSKVERIVNMAKIHDIGKIYVEDEILKSSDRLTSREYEEMKKHSQYGYDLLKDIDILQRDLDIILNHHERYDGTGYPRGVKGEDIPLGARILNVCDAFDVMTTGRSYKPAMNKDEVVQELKDCAGGQFDPQVAKAMIKLINNNKFDDSFKKELSDSEKLERLKLSLNYN